MYANSELNTALSFIVKLLLNISSCSKCQRKDCSRNKEVKKVQKVWGDDNCNGNGEVV